MKMRGRARDSILRQVADGRLGPGDWVREEALAAELGVSRTPVREAIRELASEGVLETLRNRGTRVPVSGPSSIDEALELRIVIESMALRDLLARDDGTASSDLQLAAESFADALHEDPSSADLSALVSAEAAFHSVILRQSENAALHAAYATLPVLAQTRAALSGRESLAPVATSHGELVDAIDSKDAGLADAVLVLHLRRFARAPQTTSSPVPATPTVVEGS